MKRLRGKATLLACWLVFLFSIERLFSTIDISNMTYILAFVLIVTILIVPRFARIPIWALLAVPTIIILAIKAFKGDFFSSTAVVLTIIEIFAIIITVLLANWMSISIDEFENTITKITIGRREKMPESSSVGQGFIYREVRRARNHQRPLAMMAVAVDEKSLNTANDRLIQEVQLAIIKQYMLSGVSKTLCDELEDCAIIVQSDDHFLIAVPETKPEEVPIIIERLRRQVAEQVGVELSIGTATLPEDSYTFEGLVDKANGEMKTSIAMQPINELCQLPVDKPMTVLKQ